MLPQAPQRCVWSYNLGGNIVGVWAVVEKQTSVGCIRAAEKPPAPDAWWQAHSGAAFCACFASTDDSSLLLVTYVQLALACRGGRARVGAYWPGYSVFVFVVVAGGFRAAQGWSNRHQGLEVEQCGGQNDR